MTDLAFIRRCMEKVLTGRSITFEDAEGLLGTSDIMPLADCAILSLERLTAIG